MFFKNNHNFKILKKITLENLSSRVRNFLPYQGNNIYRWLEISYHTKEIIVIDGYFLKILKHLLFFKKFLNSFHISSEVGKILNTVMQIGQDDISDFFFFNFRKKKSL